jgi:hypothetical protein
MMNLISKLALAAALTAALPAAARPCDEDVAAPAVIYPVPARAPVAYGREYGDQYEGRRHVGWREQERARLRLEYARLDDARADFYARPGVRRGQVRRFERWYVAQRAELDRQWSTLRFYATR